MHLTTLIPARDWQDIGRRAAKTFAQAAIAQAIIGLIATCGADIPAIIAACSNDWRTAAYSVLSGAATAGVAVVWNTYVSPKR